MKVKIGVVIVTYNRLDKLKKTLELFDKQTFLPNYIVVVDNASTDGTELFLKDWVVVSRKYDKNVIRMQENTGGSGGFYEGLKYAQNRTAEWIWVSDDDAFPDIDALERANEFFNIHSKLLDSIAAICGMVINGNKIDLLHRRSMKQKGLRVKTYISQEQDYKKEFFELNCFSYVGTIINKSKLKEAGLTNKEYFLWWDDTEHSLRLSKTGLIYCVPSIKIYHNVGMSNEGFTWKLYYNFRNYTDLCRKHFSMLSYKRYCFITILKTYVKDLLWINKQKNKMIRDAIRDAQNGKFGIDEVYTPTWKSNDNKCN